MNRPASPVLVFTLTLAVAAATTWLLLGPPGPERDLPWTGVVRDVVYERQAVDAALGHGVMPSDHARTPGAIVVLLPLALVPSDYLSTSASLVSVLSIALVAAGAVRLRPVRLGVGLLLALGLPVSVGFLQGVFHGSTFFPLAACLVWVWVFLLEDRPVLAGSLLGIAVVSRLWPLLLFAVLLRRRRLDASWSAGSVALLLTVLGLSLPGLSVQGSIGAVVAGGEGWISAAHNGSLASWLVSLGAFPAASIGLGSVLCFWLLGLRRSPDLSSDIAWTLPAAILASPLAWLPYLVVLAPCLLVRLRSGVTVSAVAAIVAMHLVGYRVLSQQVTVTLTLLLVGLVCWIEWLARHDPMSLKKGGQPPIGKPSFLHDEGVGAVRE